MRDTDKRDRQPPSGSFPVGLLDAPTGPAPAAAPRRDARRGGWIRGRFGTQLLVGLLLLGPVVGWLGHRVAARQHAYEAEAAFGNALSARVHDIDTEFHGAADVLRSCGALYDASDRVTREEFETFTRGAWTRHPSIVAIAWAPRVPGTARAAHERAARAEGLAGYAIVTRGPHGSWPVAPVAEEHSPILFVEPAAANPRALGFDVSSDPVRWAAVRAALATGDVVAADPVTKLQDAGGPCLSLFLGVYGRHDGEPRSGGPPLGVLMLCLQTDAIVAHAGESRHGAATDALHLTWSDASVDGRPRLLYPLALGAPPRPEAPFAAEQRLEFAGQAYAFRATPTPAFLAVHADRAPLFAATVAFLGWEMFAVSLYALARSWRSSALRRQARTVGLLMRSLSEGVLMADRDGRVVLANDAALRLLGVTLADLRAPDGLTRCGLVSPDGTAPYDEGRWPLARAAQGEVVDREELRLRRAGDANDRVLAVTARPVLDEGNVLLGGATVLQDVTAERQAEAALRRLSNALEQTADAVYVTDQDGVIRYVNAGFRSMTGFTDADALGRPPQFFEGGGGDVRSSYADRWGAVLAGETFRGTVVHRRSGGERFEAEQTLTPILDVHGRVTHAVGVMRDTTQRRRMQEAEIEMDLAGEVQQRLFPPDAPTWEGFDVVGAALPATTTCGDYYDFLRFPSGAFLLVVGDVSGHGLGPALVMAETRAYVRSLVEIDLPPDEILRRVNARLRADLADGQFVSLLVVALDPTTHRIAHASAGHPPALLFDAAGSLRARLERTGPALGLHEHATFGAEQGPVMEPGDVLVLMTDGVLDAANPADDVFDERGVVATLRACAGERAGTVLGTLHGALDVHMDGRARRDDLTLVVCRATAPAVPAARHGAGSPAAPPDGPGPGAPPTP